VGNHLFSPARETRAKKNARIRERKNAGKKISTHTRAHKYASKKILLVLLIFNIELVCKVTPHETSRQRSKEYQTKLKEIPIHHDSQIKRRIAYHHYQG